MAAAGIAGLFGLAWAGPIMVRLVGDVDFPFHLKTAQELAATGRITMPHFLLQVALGGLYATGLFPSLDAAGVVFFTGLYVLSAGLICWYIVRRTAGVVGAAASVVLAMAVLMAAPIVPRGAEDLYLIGYFPPNVYHNPTMVVAKPLLALTLMAAVAALTRTGRPTVRELALLASPVVLLGFAKPNYLGCLVPALPAAAAVWAGRAGGAGGAGGASGAGGAGRAGGTEPPATGHRLPASWVRVGVVVGAALVALAATFALYRVLEVGAAAGVIFAPLVVIAHYADVDAATIAESLLASLAFPLVATALWPRAVWRDPAMVFAWGAAVVGLFISYFLAEAGSRLYDGNFLWTGQMAVFVLFVAAAGFVASQLAGALMARRKGAPYGVGMALTLARVLAVGVVLWLHVGSGIRHVQLKVEPSRWLTFWT